MKNKNFDETAKDLKNYGERVSDLTWKGLFWGKSGALFLERERLKILKEYDLKEPFIKIKSGFARRDLLLNVISAASSTYYAASGNAVSIADGNSFDLLVFFRIFWLWRALRCLRKAEKLSDKFASLKKMEDMSLGELDARACVLNKAGRRDEALTLLRHGTERISTGKTGTKPDLCLFLIHEAEIIAGMRKYDKENKAEKNYQQAMKLMEDRAVPVLTSVRIMKSYGKFLTGVGRITEAKEVLTKALILAEASDLNDQAVKIKALLASIK